jgi:hypothetical protein
MTSVWIYLRLWVPPWNPGWHTLSNKPMS